MPFRNLMTIGACALVALTCYLEVRRIRPVEPVLDAFQHINSRYVEEVDPHELMVSTMNGLIDQLDPYSNYISPEDYEAFQSLIIQRFAGIGILIEMDEEEEYVRVLTPLVGTPALESGILPGDLILEVDGKDAAGMDLSEISDALRGPIGTKVDIVVGRGGDERVDIQVARADIPLESVTGDHRVKGNEWAYYLTEYPDIAYIRISSFGEQTAQEFRAALEKIPSDAKGLVVDLRNNQGGLLDAAVAMCDMFLDSGVIVSTRGRASPEETIRATPETVVPRSLAVALLVNENSASASEIVAGCLQDHDRVIVGGARSFGKGSVQHVLPLEEGRSALKLTTAHFYRPSGVNIHRTEEMSDEDSWGVRPRADLAVELSDELKIRLAQRWQRAVVPYALRDEIDLPEVREQGADGESEEGEKIDHDGGDEVLASGPLGDDPQLRRVVEALLNGGESPLAAETTAAPAA